jgi:transposase
MQRDSAFDAVLR